MTTNAMTSIPVGGFVVCGAIFFATTGYRIMESNGMPANRRKRSVPWVVLSKLERHSAAA